MKPKIKRRFFGPWRLVQDGHQVSLYRVNPVSGNARPTYCPYGSQFQDGEVKCGSDCPHFCLPSLSKVVNAIEITCSGETQVRFTEPFRIKKDTRL